MDYHFLDLTEFNLMLNRRELLNMLKYSITITVPPRGGRRGVELRQGCPFRHRLAGRTAVEAGGVE